MTATASSSPLDVIVHGTSTVGMRLEIPDSDESLESSDSSQLNSPCDDEQITEPQLLFATTLQEDAIISQKDALTTRSSLSDDDSNPNNSSFSMSTANACEAAVTIPPPVADEYPKSQQVLPTPSSSAGPSLQSVLESQTSSSSSPLHSQENTIPSTTPVLHSSTSQKILQSHTHPQLPQPSSSSPLPTPELPSQNPPPSSRLLALQSTLSAVREEYADALSTFLSKPGISSHIPTTQPQKSSEQEQHKRSQDIHSKDTRLPLDNEAALSLANAIIKRHISLLHEYNEIRDVGQGLMGLIAEARGVRIKDVQEEFGITGGD